MFYNLRREAVVSTQLLQLALGYMIFNTLPIAQIAVLIGQCVSAGKATEVVRRLKILLFQNVSILFKALFHYLFVYGNMSNYESCYGLGFVQKRVRKKYKVLTNTSLLRSPPCMSLAV